MYVVTGGAGFIGSNLVRGLNQLGIKEIWVVDNLKRSDKFVNLVGCEFSDFFDKEAFRSGLENGKISLDILDAIFHQGACSDTMETDGQYMMENNYTYSKILLEQAIQHRIPFVYASSAAVYGNNSAFREEQANEKPINIYGYSKYLFDQYVRQGLKQAESTVVGLRYFNVYGPHEAHKGRMASVTYQFYKQLQAEGVIRLFEGTDGIANGEQRRDFIFVSDVIRVNLFFLDQPQIKGILNVGTGNSASFNQIADGLIECKGEGEKVYVPFPETLRNKYQNFTQAEISSLRAIGYSHSFTSIREGVQQYYAYLQENPLK